MNSFSASRDCFSSSAFLRFASSGDSGGLPVLGEPTAHAAGFAASGLSPSFFSFLNISLNHPSLNQRTFSRSSSKVAKAFEIDSPILLHPDWISFSHATVHRISPLAIAFASCQTDFHHSCTTSFMIASFAFVRASRAAASIQGRAHLRASVHFRRVSAEGIIGSILARIASLPGISLRRSESSARVFPVTHSFILSMIPDVPYFFNARLSSSFRCSGLSQSLTASYNSPRVFAIGVGVH